MALYYPSVLGPSFMTATQTVNMNSVADTAFSIVLPAGFTQYRLNVLYVFAASANLTTTPVQYAIYTAAGAGGTAIITPTSSTVSTTTANTSGSAQYLSASISAYLNVATLYFRVTQALGSAATAKVAIGIQPIG